MKHPDHKAKMATPPTTPAGLELDATGRPIPFEDRTEGDKAKVRDGIAAALHGSSSVKNPENEAEIPAPMHDPGKGAPKPLDQAGQQGKAHK